MLPQPQAPPANPAVALMAPVQPMAPAPPVFTLGPGQDDTLLDYNNTSLIKMYYKAIAPLETNYDSKPSRLCIFMNSVLNRAKNYRRSNILNIDDSGGINRNLINKYGVLITEEVKNHAQTHWTNQPSRNAQNS